MGIWLIHATHERVLGYDYLATTKICPNLSPERVIRSSTRLEKRLQEFRRCSVGGSITD